MSWKTFSKQKNEYYCKKEFTVYQRVSVKEFYLFLCSVTLRTLSLSPPNNVMNNQLTLHLHTMYNLLSRNLTHNNSIPHILYTCILFQITLLLYFRSHLYYVRSQCYSFSDHIVTLFQITSLLCQITMLLYFRSHCYSISDHIFTMSNHNVTLFQITMLLYFRSHCYSISDHIFTREIADVKLNK